MTNLLLSIAALLVGPLIPQLARLGGSMLPAIDGFVLAAISALVLLHVIPESVHLGGWVTIVAGLIGLFVPSLIEHRLQRLATQAHAAALLLVLLGITIHAFADGFALVERIPASRFDSLAALSPDATSAAADLTSHQTHSILPAAVILHRIPVGLTLWLILRPLYGLGAASACLGILSLATAAGFLLGEATMRSFSDLERGLFQAVVAGSLIHVIVHRTPTRTRTHSPATISTASDGKSSGRIGAVVGALIGIILVGMIGMQGQKSPSLLDLIGYTVLSIMLVSYMMGWVPDRFRRDQHHH